MDELEISKVFGAGCAALLAFVGLGQLGSAVIGVDQLDEPAYVIEVAEVETDGESELAAPMPIGQMMAMASMDDGAKVFRKCSACHKVEKGAGGGIGPNLHGVVGREIAGLSGYDYSEALTSKQGPWDFAALSGFLEAPKKWAQGTKMGFAGLSKPEDRASVIAWMNEQSDSPLPMPAVEPEVETVETAEAAADVTVAEANVMAMDAVGRKDEESGSVTRVIGAETIADADPVETAETAEPVIELEIVPADDEPAQVEIAEAANPEVDLEVLEVVPADAGEDAAKPADTVVALAAPVPAPTLEGVAPAEAEAVEMPEVTGTDLAPETVAFLAKGDMEKGAKVFRKCKACHRVEKDGGNGVGPNLYGMVGRDIASVNGYDYSDALMDKDGMWDVEALNAFLLKPKEWAKGTKMAFAGLRKEEDRASIILWLNTHSDVPVPLPE